LPNPAGQRGTTEVDTAFLAEIEGWRKESPRISRSAPQAQQRELKLCVQRIIDPHHFSPHL